ncbi:MAG: nucleotide exchange factor GrpE [Dysgonamonadaceae bacterium]|jgi:molecular chaperone GrpE|nr:nucleotide exchange factor GrpE [Dysgonamonadaceae bacterium]
MNEKELENKIENEENFADNLAEDMPKEQIVDENGEGDNESTDNLSEKLTEWKDSYIRLMAEYDNYRKRTIKEKADLIKNGGEKVLMGLLPVIDDFQRALDTMNQATEPVAIKEGIDLIYNKFITYLQQNGVKPIESIGTLFDPDLYEAVATVPAQNEEQKGTVIDNVQIGYTLNDKVIRHAKVVVAN